MILNLEMKSIPEVVTASALETLTINSSPNAVPPWYQYSLSSRSG